MSKCILKTRQNQSAMKVMWFFCGRNFALLIKKSYLFTVQYWILIHSWHEGTRKRIAGNQHNRENWEESQLIHFAVNGGDFCFYLLLPIRREWKLWELRIEESGVGQKYLLIQIEQAYHWPWYSVYLTWNQNHHQWGIHETRTQSTLLTTLSTNSVYALNPLTVPK